MGDSFRSGPPPSDAAGAALRIMPALATVAAAHLLGAGLVVQSGRLSGLGLLVLLTACTLSASARGAVASLSAFYYAAFAWTVAAAVAVGVLCGCGYAVWIVAGAVWFNDAAMFQAGLGALGGTALLGLTGAALVACLFNPSGRSASKVTLGRSRLVPIDEVRKRADAILREREMRRCENFDAD